MARNWDWHRRSPGCFVDRGRGPPGEGTALSQYAGGLPNCDAQFTGTISAAADINAGYAVSDRNNGKVFLGETNGGPAMPGITLGGGALSGAGMTSDPLDEATTGSVIDIAIGNRASATGVDALGPDEPR